MDKQAAFKLAFLKKCAEHGVSPSEALSKLKAAREKQAVDGKAIADTLGTALKYSIAAPLALTFTATPAVGGLAGYLHSRFNDIDKSDIDEIKKRELINLYRDRTQALQ